MNTTTQQQQQQRHQRIRSEVERMEWPQFIDDAEADHRRELRSCYSAIVFWRVATFLMFCAFVAALWMLAR